MSDWYDYTGQPLYVSGIPNVWVGLKMDGEHRPPTRNLDDIEPTMKLNLFFTTRYNVTYCRISTAYVDAGVECSRASDNGALDCAVNKMRHSSGLPIEGNLTALDINLNVRVLNEMPYTLASQHPFEPSFLEQYLKDPPTAFQISYDMDKAWYEDLPLNVFENRLSMVLNTFLRSSLNITINFGNDGASLENRGSVWANATGKWSIYTTKVYQVDKTWIALFLAAALILTICAIINVILRSMIRVPDFLGSLSALTRDTPFIQAPASGSAMDGDDRSRLLRDKWVIIQDVQPNNETGRLAFTDERRTLPVSWDRKLI